MAETQTLTPLGESIPIELTTDNPPVVLGQGEEGIVTRVYATVEGKPQTFAFKRFHDFVLRDAETHGVDPADILLRLYGKAKEAGLPVMTTFQAVRENGKTIGLLMNDLTEGGENFVFTQGDLFVMTDEDIELGWPEKAEDPFSENHGTLNETKQLHLQNFLALDLSPENVFLSSMQSLAEKAAEAGILLDPGDSLIYYLTSQGKLGVVFPGEVASTRWGIYDDQGIWHAQMIGPTANSIESPLTRKGMAEINLQTAISTFADIERYQKIKQGKHTDFATYLGTYVTRARDHFGLPKIIA